MHNTGEILQLCRLCLVKEQVNVPIFEGQGDVKQIFQKISSCLPVKINRSDKLPKNICDGCSEKLDLFYDFWNTSVNSEKQLLEWLGQTPLSAGAGTTIAAKNSKSTDPVQQIKVDVKQEPSDHTDNNESFQADASAVADEDETSFKSEGGPPPKRARRAATKRKPITVAPDTDDDDDDDYEPVEPLTKLEDESGNSDNDNEDDSFANAPSTSADDQPGPSGIGKDGVEAPIIIIIEEDLEEDCHENEESTVEINDNIIEIDEDLEEILEDLGEKTQNEDNSNTNNGNIVVLNEETQKENVKDKKSGISCSICNRRYKSEEYLKAHYELHFNGKGFPCTVCPKVFQTQEGLADHEAHHKKKIYECEQCEYASCRSVDLERHMMLTHDKTYNITTAAIAKTTCKICQKTYKTTDGLRIHSRKHRQRVAAHKCEYCDKAFYMPSHLEMHKRYHTEIGEYPCDRCPKKFKHQQYLEGHQKRVHHGLIKKYLCEICASTFNAKTGYDTHMRKHMNAYIVRCEECDLGFTTNEQYERHCSNKHGLKKYICHVCGRNMATSFDLKLHIGRHASEEEKRKFGVKCTDCDKMFAHELLATEHHRVVHSRKYHKYIICRYCGKSVLKTTMKKHLQVHEKRDEEVFTCSYCGDIFSYEQTLKRHVKENHEDPAIYHKCDKCDKKFRSLIVLKIHHDDEHEFEDELDDKDPLA